MTLLGIEIAGGVSTSNRYRELYSHPLLKPQLLLEYELRLPVDKRLDGDLPDVAALSEGAKNDGRILITGRIPMTGTGC